MGSGTTSANPPTSLTGTLWLVSTAWSALASGTGMRVEFKMWPE
jgi:hypothetical protein